MPAEEVGIAHMPGHAERIERAAAPDRRRPRGRCARRVLPRGAPAQRHRLRARTRRHRGRALRRRQAGHDRCIRRCCPISTGRTTSSTSSSGATPVSSERNSRSCCAGSGVDADPGRRPDRRLRALHVRRRPPARLLRPRGHRLRRRLVAVPPRRGPGRHGVPADRCAAHHRRDPRAFASTSHTPSSKEPHDDARDSARLAAAGADRDARAERLRRFGFRQQHPERRTDRQGAAPVVPAGPRPAAGPRHLLRRPGPAADHEPLRGPAAVQGGHRQARNWSRCWPPSGRPRPTTRCSPSSCARASSSTTARRSPRPRSRRPSTARLAVNQGPAYMVTDIESVTTQGDYGVTITLKAPNSAFLDYLACPYGPRMLSPEGLKKNAGTDNAQNYLTNHDLGTGPYTLTDARGRLEVRDGGVPRLLGPQAVLREGRAAGHHRRRRRSSCSSTTVSSPRSCTTCRRRRCSPTSTTSRSRTTRCRR